MSKNGCICKATRASKLKDWRVIDRHCNYSAFSGYKFTPSDYSLIVCLNCKRHWRTKAQYVEELEDITDDEGISIGFILDEEARDD